MNLEISNDDHEFKYSVRLMVNCLTQYDLIKVYTYYPTYYSHYYNYQINSIEILYKRIIERRY